MNRLHAYHHKKELPHGYVEEIRFAQRFLKLTI